MKIGLHPDDNIVKKMYNAPRVVHIAQNRTEKDTTKRREFFESVFAETGLRVIGWGSDRIVFEDPDDMYIRGLEKVITYEHFLNRKRNPDVGTDSAIISHDKESI